ncbi:C-type lectin domain family 2 member B-like [Phyllobates terribilis]|uniref:C-type lectin domain family 2 member B-like n=1 Tax=Phyllobates terribilis TaxID=111132 RepID=UPI003CCB6A8F
MPSTGSEVDQPNLGQGVVCWTEENPIKRTKIRAPSWKTVLIASIVIVVSIILIRSIGWFFQAVNPENCTRLAALKKELCVTTSGASDSCSLCPPHWPLYGDHCYYYSHVTDKTWNQSRDDCKMMGADLLAIKDLEQQNFMASTLKKWSEDLYWIGLHRDGDVWRWVDGEHYTGSFFPIKTDAGGCVSMSKSGYFQSSCNSKFRFICVKKSVRI